MKEVVEITKNEGERVEEIKKLKDKVKIQATQIIENDLS